MFNKKNMFKIPIVPYINKKSFGRLKMDLSDGVNTKTFELNDPCRGIYLPRMLYISLYDFSPGAVGLVLASTHYDISRSLRSWDDYLKAIKIHDNA